jgi:putative redox protein
MPAPEVVVRGCGTGFAQQIFVGAHGLIADEPVEVGGTDTGPSPYELLAAALGACTSMTIGMYARKKNWAVADIVVRLRHSKVHATDCVDCETKEGMLDHIDREIELTGNLSVEQRAKLLEIADKCPVHRTLARAFQIHSRLV